MPTLQFKGKTVIETYHHTVPHHRLELDAGLSVLGKGEKPSLEGNLIIEGDNLLALKALLPTHAGRIKCVYIDPPYNTGDEGWVYNDNLTQPQFKEWIGQTVGKEGEDACRHDKWCCMIYPRLSLLKELLHEDGIILVSVDENEVLNLRPLLDELFGTENFVEMFVWQKSYGGGAKSKHVVRLHEYVICFAKNKSRLGRLSLPPDPAAAKYYKGEDDKVATRGKYRTQPLWTNSMDERANLRFPIPYKGEEIWPEKQWQWSEDRVLEALENDELVFVPGETGVSVYYKQYQRDEDGVERGAKPYSIIEGIYTQQGTNELTRIFNGSSRFKFPKPSALIKHLMMIFTADDDVVLDSFAGSGTTGHAALELNRQLRSQRRFVLVQMPFDNKEYESDGVNIAKEITRVRLQRVIEGYEFRSRTGKKKKVAVEGLGGSFTYARVGDPLLDEYKRFAKKMPAWEDLAKYIFYTETSRQVDLKKLDEKSGFIGATEAAGGTSYYLFYTPDREASEPVGTTKLKDLLKRDKRKHWVIYCEKIWIHQDELRQFEREHGKRIRLMQAPFQLR